MLFFTSARAPALRRSRDPADWLSAAGSIDPGAVMEHAKADIASVARQLRASTPAIADELLSSGPDTVRKSLLRVVPRRRRRRRWPLLLLAFLGMTAAATIVARMLMQRRTTSWAEPAPWTPTPMPATRPDEEGVRPPRGLPGDVTTNPETLDRDAAIRAAGEGMEAPDEAPSDWTGTSDPGAAEDRA